MHPYYFENTNSTTNLSEIYFESLYSMPLILSLLQNVSTALRYEFFSKKTSKKAPASLLIKVIITFANQMFL